MSADLDKLVLLSSIPSFMADNNPIVGTLYIEGQVVAGGNERKWTVPMSLGSDYYDIMFDGPSYLDMTGLTTVPDLRDKGWFRSGGWMYIRSRHPTDGDMYSLWTMNAYIDGGLLYVSASYMHPFDGASVMYRTPFRYKVIPYSSTV